MIVKARFPVHEFLLEDVVRKEVQKKGNQKERKKKIGQLIKHMKSSRGIR